MERQGRFRILFFLFPIIAVFTATLSCFADPTIKLGIEVLTLDHLEMIQGKKLAILIAPTSLNHQLSHSIDILAKYSTIQVIFTGNQYFRPTISGGSETPQLDERTNSPVIEITDPLKRPSRKDLRGAEAIVIDFQDIGIRYFNYVTLLAQFLELARQSELPVIVLDRPNPINGYTVSGPVLEVNFRSRYGVYPIPLIYGMTIGELALYFNKVFGLGANLTVIGMENYSRVMTFSETGLYWAMPSDHLPEADSPSYYAITGFLGEMGVFSTGVGATRPFHYILAPWLDGAALANKISKYNLPGVRFLPISIKPFYGLFQLKKIPGIEIVILDHLQYDPFLTGVAILRSLWDLYPDKIPLKNPAISESLDTLLGGSAIRNSILKGIPLFQIHASMQPAIRDFLSKRKAFIMYPEN